MNTRLPRLHSLKLITFFVGIIFSLSLSAQLSWSGSPLVVPIEDILLVDDISMYSFSHNAHAQAGGPASLDGTGGYEVKNDLIEYTDDNDYFEYQIISPKSGQFGLILPVASKRTNASINVSVYPVGSTFVMNGTTCSTYNGEWAYPDDYIFPFQLESGVIYNLRVTIIDGGSNIIDGLRITELEGSTDATLSDLKIDGVTVSGFDPAIDEYSIVLYPFEMVDEITATPNNEATTVEIEFSDDVFLDGANYDAVIRCTSESGVTHIYTVNFFIPTEVFDGYELLFNENYLFSNNGVGIKGTKLNSFGNGDYIEYYIFSAFDENIVINVECTNGYTDADSYLNISTLAMDDSTWVVDNRYTQYIPTTYNTENPTLGEWNSSLCNPNNIPFVLSIHEYEPVRLRIYSITNKGTAADISNISFSSTNKSIDNTLRDLTVDGVSIADFDPAIISYTVPLALGATQVEIGATANDADAKSVEGVGIVNLNGNSTTAEVVVTSEAGYPLTYAITFVTPKAIVAGDTLALEDDIYCNNGAEVSNDLIGWFKDSTYVEYYIYSATDTLLHLSALAVNGNDYTTYSKMNVSTYTLGDDWSAESGITKDITSVASNVWSVDYASEVEYNISLAAYEPVILRISAFTDSYISVADIFNLTFKAGHTIAGGEDDGLPADTSSVWPLPTVIWNGSPLTVPTDSILLVDDITKYSLSHYAHTEAGAPASYDGEGGVESKKDVIGYLYKGDYIEYQIISPTSGQFALTLPVSSNRTNSNINVSVYPVDSTFEMKGVTTATYNGTWTDPTDYSFPFELEAGVTYNMRVTILDDGCDLFADGLAIQELPKSTDATLAVIILDDSVAIRDFDAATLSYTVVVDSLEEIENMISAVAADKGATLSITQGSEADSSMVRISVTAQDQETSLTYEVKFLLFADLSADATLSSIYLDESVPLEGFDTDIMSYTVMVNSLEEIETMISAVASDENANVTINQADQADGSKAIITVTAQNLMTTLTYEVVFALSLSNDATLASIAINESLNIEGFDADVTSYTVMMDSFEEIEIMVSAVPTDENASFIISQAIKGDSLKVSITVTAQDLVTTLTYDVVFLLEVNLSNDATLASISLNDSVTLEGFDADITSYTVMMDSLEEIEIMISAVPNDENATFTISQAISKDVLKFTITVTAQDSETTLTYVVNFMLSGASGIDVTRESDDFKLYPNPILDVLNISAESDILNVKLYSISGVLLNEFSGFNAREVSLDLNIESGLYLVSVATTKGMFTKQIVKQ